MRLNTLGLRMRPALAAVAAFALCVGLAMRPAAADVDEHIPADALVVIKINNIQQVNAEAGALMRDFGLAGQVPELADPVAAFQNETGLKDGINLGGNAAFYIANGQMGGDEPPFVILIPVSDYEAFLGNFAAMRDAGDGVTQFKFREADAEGEQEDEVDWDDDSGYAMQMGEYAAITPHRELLVNPERTIQFTGVTGEMAAERDVVAYVNFEQVGPMLTGMLQQQDARAQAKAKFAEAIEENPQFAKYQPVADAAIDQAFTLAENFLRDASAGAGAMDLSDAGIRFGWAWQFKPGSYFSRLFGQMNATGDLPLSGLPEGNYIFFGGNVDNQQLNQQFVGDFLGPIIEELRTVEGSEKLVEYVEAIQTQASAAGESRFGMLAPSGPLGNTPLFQQVYVQGGDVERLKQAQRRAAELQPELMQELLGGAEGMDEMGVPPGMAMTMQYTENAKEISGVSFDKLGMDMEQADPQMAMPMRMIFGPEGPTSLIGEVDGKLVVITGLTDQQITQVVEAVRANEAPLADDAGVQAVKRQLLDRASGVFFFRPDELVRTGVGYARQMGMNVPIQLQENLPPIGFSGGPAENGIRAEAFFPKELVSSLIVAVLQAQQHFGGMGEDMEEPEMDEDDQ